MSNGLVVTAHSPSSSTSRFPYLRRIILYQTPNPTFKLDDLLFLIFARLDCTPLYDITPTVYLSLPHKILLYALQIHGFHILFRRHRLHRP
jgi:hypothetical protein